MSTNIPPHNFKELANAIIAQIKNPKISVEKLIEIIPGPDFPTGGIIHGSKEIIKQVYSTGRGIIKLKKAFVETETNSIVITEIPYQVNKSKLIEKIADLVKDKIKLRISDIRDETNRDGMRIVIDPKE